MSNPLSVIIICMNEQSRIRACLESVTWADEIIIMDSGSSDRTLEIASEFTDKIYHNTDWQGFGPQKFLAESKATNNWVLSIDSDEVVNDELREEILNALQAADDKTVYRVNRLPEFCGQYIKHSGWHPDLCVRLYNKKFYHYNDAVVHESVACKGAPVIDLKGYLLHFTFESLEAYMEKRNRYAKDWARGQFEKGRRTGISEILLHTLFAFLRHYVLKLGVLDGYPGFLISVIQMQYTFNKYNYLKFMDKPNV